MREFVVTNLSVTLDVESKRSASNLRLVLFTSIFGLACEIGRFVCNNLMYESKRERKRKNGRLEERRGKKGRERERKRKIALNMTNRVNDSCNSLNYRCQVF